MADSGFSDKKQDRVKRECNPETSAGTNNIESFDFSIHKFDVNSDEAFYSRMWRYAAMSNKKSMPSGFEYSSRHFFTTLPKTPTETGKMDKFVLVYAILISRLVEILVYRQYFPTGSIDRPIPKEEDKRG
jgi:hypothetical protein